MKSTIHAQQKTNFILVSKNQIKKFGLLLFLAITLFSCTPNEEVITTANTESISPANGKSFSAVEAQQPITFKWTPIVPKPNEPITYRLKVWQLMSGQNLMEAMRTNPPIIIKDVDNVTEITISGIYNGPCRPPMLCQFVWTVQEIDSNGSPIESSNGTTIMYEFNFQ